MGKTWGMERKGNACKILAGKRIGKKPLGRPGVDGRILLKWTLNNTGGRGLD
jgi:hypothetical protein